MSLSALNEYVRNVYTDFTVKSDIDAEVQLTDKQEGSWFLRGSDRHLGVVLSYVSNEVETAEVYKRVVRHRAVDRHIPLEIILKKFHLLESGGLKVGTLGPSQAPAFTPLKSALKKDAPPRSAPISECATSSTKTTNFRGEWSGEDRPKAKEQQRALFAEHYTEAAHTGRWEPKKLTFVDHDVFHLEQQLEEQFNQLVSSDESSEAKKARLMRTFDELLGEPEDAEHRAYISELKSFTFGFIDDYLQAPKEVIKKEIYKNVVYCIHTIAFAHLLCENSGDDVCTIPTRTELYPDELRPTRVELLQIQDNWRLSVQKRLLKQCQELPVNEKLDPQAYKKLIATLFELPNTEFETADAKKERMDLDGNLSCAHTIPGLISPHNTQLQNVYDSLCPRIEVLVAIFQGKVDAMSLLNSQMQQPQVLALAAPSMEPYFTAICKDAADAWATIDEQVLKAISRTPR